MSDTAVLLVVKYGYHLEYTDVHGNKRVHGIPLRQAEELVVGRSDLADIVLGHETVSRQHAGLFFANGALYVRDFGSRNGTHIGDEQLEPHQETLLKPDTCVRFGELEVTLKLSRYTPGS